MADGLCDWQDCESTHVHPVELRVEREDHDPDFVQPLERRYELCAQHTAALSQFLHHAPLHVPLDAGVGE